MQIKRFAVKGFKNFNEEVVLDDLGKIAVIHGENNVGKSNLLEAMQLFFKLLSLNGLDQDGFEHKVVDKVKFGSVIIRFSILKERLEDWGFLPTEIFNLDSSKPIELSAIFTVSPEELKQAAIQVLFPTSEVQVDAQLRYIQDIQGKTKYQVTQKLGELSQHHDVFTRDQTHSIRLAAFWARKMSPQQEATDRFVLIKLDRHISVDEIEEKTRAIIPQSLSLQLYDARDSTDPSISQKWKLFVKIMQKFNDILGDGEFVLTFKRQTNRANLAFDSTATRIPINLLGSGIQQIAALIARLLMSNATVVAIEEPELNLRYTLQLRLREIFQEIVEDPAGPQQIFLTSHSPAFEFGEYFYAMRKVNGLPHIEKRPIKEAGLFTQDAAISPLAGQKAPLCYVSTEGLVKVPDRICEMLGLEEGGGVVFVERKDGHVAMLTDDQFMDLFEEEKEEKEEEDSEVTNHG